MAGAVDLVTETDKKCEELVLGTIHRSFPDHKFIGEEGSAAQASSDQQSTVVLHSQCMAVNLMAPPGCHSNAENGLQALNRLTSLAGLYRCADIRAHMDVRSC